MNTDITEIIPHLYLSNWYASNNADIISKYNIKAVLTLETMPKPNDILKYYKKNNIDFKYIDISDSPYSNISQYFDPSYELIKKHIENNENILVHCYAGVSRSSTIVLNYLIRNIYDKIKKVNSSPRDVVQKITEFLICKRPVVNPNDGFMNQILKKTIEYDRMK